MKIVTVEHMRRIEAAADKSGVSYEMMMDNAGKAAARVALQMINGLDEPRITILVGTGNNGGDGLVAGRYILEAQANAQLRLYLLKARDDDPLLEAIKDNTTLIAHAADDKDGRVLRNAVASADLIIDALFGIGVRLPIKGNAAQILQNVNRGLNERRSERDPERITNPAAPQFQHYLPQTQVLAIDCPSGLDCDTGEIDSNAVPADATITFIAFKPGLVTFPGAAHVGKLYGAAISIPDDLEEMREPTPLLATGEHVRTLLPSRSTNTHKGSYGKALIVAGSTNYIGAAGLASKAAYRSGTGLVTVAAPGPVVSALATAQPETTWIMVPHDLGVTSDKAVKIVLENLNDYTALLVGPGMGQEDTTGDFLLELLNAPSQVGTAKPQRHIGFTATADSDDDTEQDEQPTLPPLVIDADGLNLLARQKSWWERLPEDTIITPHPGEMARLSDRETGDIQSNRLAIASEMAASWNVILVLKGAHTIIAAPDGQTTIMPFKNDALATAGTGDVLAGLIVGLRAQGLEAYSAAAAGAYIHGLAGEILVEKSSSRAVTAGDLLDAIGLALRQIEKT